MPKVTLLKTVRVCLNVINLEKHQVEVTIFMECFRNINEHKHLLNAYWMPSYSQNTNTVS